MIGRTAEGAAGRVRAAETRSVRPRARVAAGAGTLILRTTSHCELAYPRQATLPGRAQQGVARRRVAGPRDRRTHTTPHYSRTPLRSIAGLGASARR